jgi:hypothetical protein
LAQGNGKSCDPFGRHLGDTYGVAMGKIMGKSWENHGKIMGKSMNMFIIFSSYVHHMFIGSRQQVADEHPWLVLSLCQP